MIQVIEIKQLAEESIIFYRSSGNFSGKSTKLSPPPLSFIATVNWHVGSSFL